MLEEKKKDAIFISYAWGGPLEHKEWLRQRIIKPLDWKYRVFWDRDSIGFGESIDKTIAQALGQRPVSVFCICDSDYLVAAQRVNSGLYRELQMLTQIADHDGVRIIPVIFDADSAADLPEPLAGRAYLNIHPLLERGLDLSTVLLGVAEGATQAQVNTYMAGRLRANDLRQRAVHYFSRQKMELWGNALTHEVRVCQAGRPPRLLLPAQWMCDSDEWGFMLDDDNPTYCPSKGRWHWDYSSPSRGMRALGTATISAFFPDRKAPDDQVMFATAGAVLARSVFAMTYKTEAFNLAPAELINLMINDAEGYAALEHLLPPAT
ncbi:hypothetical protein PspCFBP13508_14955 [Pseudomonas sp. CFBP13508]|jgi:phosphoribosyl-AMP cyclohydrolase|uniref:toll/interleukin-1 receptor domain-containing protein n=1 Tax=Pseudomonas sp. CFBP13508 TaxID=2184009 RepID=UPI0010BF6E5B|nr:toll/interleukin-1 receptor domain-containing protein [Pseudomonas sp. CFBP13508]TKJ71940.1 hypothetical protein PspCFBP13508_14955 [Pseudomonas sp. CFBP13508]